MFTAGWVLRKKDGGTGAIFSDRSASTGDDLERRKFRCYVPLVRHSLLATVAGLVVMATGASFCVVGFYSGREHEIQESNNDTEVIFSIT